MSKKLQDYNREEYQAYYEILEVKGQKYSTMLKDTSIPNIIKNIPEPKEELDIHRKVIIILVGYIETSSFSNETKKDLVLQNLMHNLDLTKVSLREFRTKYKKFNKPGIDEARDCIIKAGLKLSKISDLLELREGDKRPTDDAKQREKTEWEKRWTLRNDEIRKLGDDARILLEDSFHQLS